MESFSYIQNHINTLQLTDILEMILKNGWNPETSNRNGRTILISACKENKLRVVEILLQYQANINHQDYHGTSALNISSEYGFYEIVKILLQHKEQIINLNTQDSDGDTPLICASWKNHEPIIKLLLSYGANPFLQNKKYKNCIHHALENGWNLSKISEVYNYNVPIKHIEFIEPKTCFICYEEYQNDVQYFQCIKCQNIFCKDCITPWFQTKTTYDKKCPYCANIWIQHLFVIQKKEKNFLKDYYIEELSEFEIEQCVYKVVDELIDKILSEI